MKEMLKQATILYVEDEEKLRIHFNSILEMVIKKVYIAKDGKEALEIYKKYHENIDLIVTDIEMPNLNGIELLKEIRLIDENIPCIIISAFFEADYLSEAIEHNVSGYFTKPVDTLNFFKKVAYLYKQASSSKSLIYKEKELQDYLEVLNKVAIISKTDLKGTITYVNDIFCEVAKYSREELIGQAHNIVRHSDMPKSAFKDMWDTIQSEKMWYGKVKNKAKDGSAYFVKASVFPLYDNNDNLKGYIAIRFLTTDDEVEKREFKKNVIIKLAESRKKESNLEQMMLTYKEENILIKDKLNILELESGTHIQTIVDQKTQIKFYEEESINGNDRIIKLLKNKSEELERYTSSNKKLKLEKDDLFKSNRDLKINNEDLRNENNSHRDKILNYSKKIDDLLTIIEDKK